MSGPRRSRRAPLVVLAVLLVAGGFLLALLAAHVDPPHYAALPTEHTTSQTVAPTLTNHVSGGASGHSASSDNRARHEVGSLIIALYVLLVLAAVVTFVVFLVQALLARRGGHERGRRLTEERGHDLPPELVAARLADAAAAGLDELAAERPATDVIIACWQRLRAAADAAGSSPVASDTPEQAVTRVLAAGAVSADMRRPLETLAALYREARFSAHAMSRGDVWIAREALRSILAELRPDDPGAAVHRPAPGADDVR